MEPEFWQNRWQERRIGFHRADPNPILLKYLAKLQLPAGARIMVPLCGKTLDIGWLAAQGYHVVGAELSPIAVKEFFEELGVAPTITEVGPLKKHSVPQIDIYLGNIFDLSKEELGQVDGIYDRAALVALPLDIRNRYSAHLRQITGTAPQLLGSFEYDESLIEGPPFAITAEGIAQQYAGSYDITELARYDYEGKLKGTDHPATETVWLLVPKK